MRLTRGTRYGIQEVLSRTDFACPASVVITMNEILWRVAPAEQPAGFGTYVAERGDSSLILAHSRRVGEGFRLRIALCELPGGGCRGSLAVMNWHERRSVISDVGVMAHIRTQTIAAVESLGGAATTRHCRELGSM